MPLTNLTESVRSETLIGAGLVAKEQKPVTPQPDDFKVLVADDSAIYRKLVGHALAEKNWQVLFAQSGSEAMEIYAKHRPALVITDRMMPDFSGLELCESIRQYFKETYTYIIIVTGMTEKHEIINGLTAGADDYLTKPFDAGELLARASVGHRVIDLHRQIEAKNQLLEELALTDPLTALPNRRAIEEWSSRQLSGATRYDFSFWIVAIDLDYFKSINDTYGHEAGDAVLKKVADILRKNCRKCEICGRVGGEEFLMSLSHITVENVKMVVNRVRTEIEGTKFNFGGKEVTVTASFGAAGFQGQARPELRQIIADADAALYSAKRLGRNRLEFAPVAACTNKS
jgi:diguanylate cyclase (GGDEF)-like protein